MPAALDKQLLQEAADWAITLHYDAPSQSQLRAFDLWRAESPAHAAAWRQAQKVFDTFERVPKKISKPAIKGIERHRDRRRALKLLSLGLLAGPGAWALSRQTHFQRWTADVATAAGEQKEVTLADGSLVLLNTRSAINIAFSRQTRRIRLAAGEVLITTHPDSFSTPRPFLVETPGGVARALGTRFSVRNLNGGERSRVAVFENAVEITTATGLRKTLAAGQQADFSAESIFETTKVKPGASLWEQGTLLARSMRLGDVVTELARYRSGVLRCDPAIADLRVSGAISLRDTDAALNLLANNLALKVSRISPYWVTLKPGD